MKRSHIIIALIAGLTLVFVSGCFVPVGRFDTALNVITNFFTVIVGVYLLNRFGAESTVINRQVETVLNLVENLSSISISIDGLHFEQQNKIYINYNPLRTKITGGELLEWYNLHRKTPVCFHVSYAEKDILSQYIVHPLIPATIKEKLLLFDLTVLHFDAELDKSFKISISPSPLQDGIFGGPLTRIDLETFHDNWQSIITEIKGFLKQNSAIPLDLNF